MKGNKLIIFALALVVTGVLILVAVLIVVGSDSISIGEAGSNKEVKTVIVPAKGEFRTELIGARSFIYMNIHIETIEDKKLLEVMERRDPEARSKVLDILRDKTVEDVNGTQGKISLEREILDCYRSLYGKEGIINIYIDDIIIQ